MSTHDDAEKALRMVREADILSYDTETSGVDWKVNFPVGYVIGADASNVVYIPVRHQGGGNLPDPDVRLPEEATSLITIHRFERELAKAFRDRTKKTVGHHLKFDCHLSANAGVMLGRNLSCTQNNETLLDEYTREFSLDATAKRYGVTAKRGDDLYKHLARLFGGKANKSAMEHFWRTAGDDPLAVDYSIGDGVTTYEIYQKQIKLIEAEGLTQVSALEDELIWTLFRMERRGIKVDEDYLVQTRQMMEQRIADAVAELPSGFNVRSPNDVKAWVEKAGYTDWPTTEKGNPSFTEKWLKKFPEGELIVTVRKFTNLINSFIDPMVNEHTYKGRVHATLNQLKSEDYGTPARLSCSRPNLQQIPKRDKELAKIFRKAFVADEGMEFWEADYSQCEPRLFAHYSKEPALLEGYNMRPFRDMHSVVADLLQVERDPTAKRMNMGILTGMYPKSFASHMGMDVEQATRLWNQWFEAFPKIRDFQDTAKNVLKKRGYVKTLLGRRGRLEQPRFAYKAVSKIIQGGNADILKHFMLDLDKMLEESGDIAYLVMTVHDAFEWEAPATPEGNEISQEMMRRMVKVQEDPFNLLVPFVVEADKGKNWAEATFGANNV